MSRASSGGGDGCGCLIMALIAAPFWLPVILLLPLPWLVAEASAFRRGRPGEGFELTRSEFEAVRELLASRDDVVEKREQAVRMARAEGFKLRKDGKFDERKPRAVFYNTKLDEASAMIMRADSLVRATMAAPGIRYRSWANGRRRLWALRFAMPMWFVPIALRSPIIGKLLASIEKLGDEQGGGHGLIAVTVESLPAVGVLLSAMLVGFLFGHIIVRASAPPKTQEALYARAYDRWGMPKG